MVTSGRGSFGVDCPVSASTEVNFVPDPGTTDRLQPSRAYPPRGPTRLAEQLVGLRPALSGPSAQLATGTASRRAPRPCWVGRCLVSLPAAFTVPRRSSRPRLRPKV